MEDFKELYLSEKKRADENWDKYVRQVAENKNSKRRLEREVENFKTFANESILKDMLIISDNLQLAYRSGNSKGSEGILLILREIYKIFENYGVEHIESLGKEFDPNKMEAVYVENTGGPKNRVIKVLQDGYTLNGRILRPTKVVVSK